MHGGILFLLITPCQNKLWYFFSRREGRGEDIFSLWGTSFLSFSHQIRIDQVTDSGCNCHCVVLPSGDQLALFVQKHTSHLIGQFHDLLQTNCLYDYSLLVFQQLLNSSNRNLDFLSGFEKYSKM